MASGGAPGQKGSQRSIRVRMEMEPISQRDFREHQICTLVSPHGRPVGLAFHSKLLLFFPLVLSLKKKKLRVKLLWLGIQPKVNSFLRS